MEEEPDAERSSVLAAARGRGPIHQCGAGKVGRYNGPLCSRIIRQQPGPANFRAETKSVSHNATGNQKLCCLNFCLQNQNQQ